MSEKKVETKYYCQSCGEQIKPTDTTCPKCGKNLSEAGRRIEKTFDESVGLSSSFTIQVKPVDRRGKVKLVGEFLGSFLVFAVLIFGILFLVTRSFPDYVPISNADDLLRIMINVDGILLGFVGIVFAQLLSSIMDQQNVLYQRILEKPDEAVESMKSLEYMDLRKYALSFIAIGTFVSLLMSIFVSMANIAKNSKLLPTDTFATFGILFGPLYYTIIAVMFLTFALVFLPMRPPLKRVQKDNQPKA
ncbi:MAG: zinc-ribbon domain-containing protein [Candidatus Bathyarchaeia archaeon]